MSPATRTATVIGGGIGGLAAAIALRRAGLEVEVHEAADEIRPLGAGLSIWPNGVRALRSLGLGDVAEAPGVQRGGGALRRADGSVLAEFEPDAIAARYGAPLVGVNRGDLHAALLTGLGDESLRLGSRLLDLDDGTLRFADGTESRPALIVGADGLRSIVRERLVGDGEPVDSEIVAFRGLAVWEAEVPAGEWWATDTVAGLLPLAGGLVYWYVACRGEADPAELERHLSHFSDPLPRIVSATALADVLCHRLYDRQPVKRWGDGRATVLGDAAHPMLPFLGQGACSALEDAVALGEAVAQAPDPRAALGAYEQRRIGRTTALVRGSRRAGSVALLGAPVGRRVRDALVARAPASMRLRQLDAVVGR